MRLITHNMLTSNIKGVQEGFPLGIQAEKVRPYRTPSDSTTAMTTIIDLNLYHDARRRRPDDPTTHAHARHTQVEIVESEFSPEVIANAVPCRGAPRLRLNRQCSGFTTMPTPTLTLAPTPKPDQYHEPTHLPRTTSDRPRSTCIPCLIGDSQFIQNMLPKLEFDAFVAAAKELGVTDLPAAADIDDAMRQDEAFLQKVGSDC